MFYGILIRMFLKGKEHNPPHIHAIYQDDEAVFDIRTSEKTEGSLPGDKEKLVSTWIVLHRDELLADWALAQQGESPFRIDPLR